MDGYGDYEMDEKYECVYTLINQMSMVAVPLLATRDLLFTRLLTTKSVKLFTIELSAIFFIIRLFSREASFNSFFVCL